MKNLVLEYIETQNSLSLRFQNKNKYIYSIYGNNNISLKGVIEVNNKNHYPQIMIDMENPNTADYRSAYVNKKTKNIIKKLFRIFRKLIDILIYQKLKLLSLSPSFIIIAKKN